MVMAISRKEKFVMLISDTHTHENQLQCGASNYGWEKFSFWEISHVECGVQNNGKNILITFPSDVSFGYYEKLMMIRMGGKRPSSGDLVFTLTLSYRSKKEMVCATWVSGWETEKGFLMTLYMLLLLLLCRAHIIWLMISFHEFLSL
jgi:hypothetical protein